MKILFVLNALNLGGAQRVVTLLANYYCENHEVHILTLSQKSQEPYFPLDNRIVLHSFDYKFSCWRYLLFMESVMRLRSLVREICPDKVFSFLTHPNITSMLALGSDFTRLYIAERNFPPFRSLSPVLRFLTYKSLDRSYTRVIVQTRDSAEKLRQRCPSTRVRVIPNPVLLPKISDGITYEDLKISRKIILCVGRIVHQKQFEIAIEAFSMLTGAMADHDLVIIGNGPLESDLKEYRPQNLTKKIHILPATNDIFSWYRRSRIFLSCSKHEGYPNALLEALCCGLPVVSFNYLTGPSDLIEDGKNGILVDPSSGAKGLSHALLRVGREYEMFKRNTTQLSDSYKQRHEVQTIARYWLDD